MDERRGELDALLVAERELLDRPLRKLSEPEPLGPGGHRRGRLGGRAAVQLGEVAELAVRAHLRVEATLLGHVAEGALLLAPHRVSLPADLAAVRLEHPQRDTHGRRLAGAIGADEAEQLALFRPKREPVEGHSRAVATAHVDEFEHRASLFPVSDPPTRRRYLRRKALMRSA